MSPDDLKRMHTRLLLKGLRSKRASDSRFSKTLDDIFECRGLEQEHHSKEIVEAIHLGGGWCEESTITIAQLKSELATREHVPNKQESTAARKARKKSSKKRGRKDR